MGHTDEDSIDKENYVREIPFDRCRELVAFVWDWLYEKEGVAAPPKKQKVPARSKHHKPKKNARPLRERPTVKNSSPRKPRLVGSKAQAKFKRCGTVERA